MAFVPGLGLPIAAAVGSGYCFLNSSKDSNIYIYIAISDLKVLLNL